MHLHVLLLQKVILQGCNGFHLPCIVSKISIQIRTNNQGTNCVENFRISLSQQNYNHRQNNRCTTKGSHVDLTKGKGTTVSDKKLSYRKETVRLLHNIESRILHYKAI